VLVGDGDHAATRVVETIVVGDLSLERFEGIGSEQVEFDRLESLSSQLHISISFSAASALIFVNIIAEVVDAYTSDTPSSAPSTPSGKKSGTCGHKASA
jgi:hypothetical protein